MGTGVQLKGIALAVLAATSLIGVARAEAQSDQEYTGIRLQVDNDLFAGRERDRDYTGGLAISISGTAARDGFLSLDPLLERLDALTREQHDEVHYARQFGFMAFTPQDIVSSEIQEDDLEWARRGRRGSAHRVVEQLDDRCVGLSACRRGARLRPRNRGFGGTAGL